MASENVEKGQSEEKPAPGPPRPRVPAWALTTLYVAAPLLLLVTWQGMLVDVRRSTIPYSEFKAHPA